jgi:hypothetical protein
LTTNEVDRTDDRTPRDPTADEPEAEEIEEIEEDEHSRLSAEPEPSPIDEPETEAAGAAADDTVVQGGQPDGAPSGIDTAPGDVAPGADGPLLGDATGYQERWYEIQTRFVDEPGRAVQSAGQLLTEVMDDLARRLADELEASNARGGGSADASTEDLRMTFQRYRSFFDRLLTA